MVDAEGLRLTSYVGGRRRTGGEPAADALLSLYARQEIAASVLLRGTQGSGLRRQLRAGRPATPGDCPAVAVAVDARPRIEAVLEQAVALAGPGLVTVQHVWMLDEDTGPLGLAGLPGPAGLDQPDARLTVYLSRDEQAYQIPAFEAICDLLYRRGVAGATALPGVDGTCRGRRRRAGFMGRREEPVMVLAVGAAEQLMRIIPEVSGLLRHPLLTLEPVRVCKRDGLLLGVPGRPSGASEQGMPLWQQLTVYTSEAAQHDGEPIHRVLARRLLAAGLSRVTTLRGIWGFHAEHAPHGGRPLHLARHVPAVTAVTGTPERIAAAFGIIDELTGGRGLVTSETVPAAGTVSAPR